MKGIKDYCLPAEDTWFLRVPVGVGGPLFFPVCVTVTCNASQPGDPA